jgi:hypothetical protein
MGERRCHMYALRFPKNIKQKLKRIQDLANLNEQYVEDVHKQIIQEAYRRVIEHIDKQDLGWKPLNEEYLLRKIREGYNPGKWIRTGLLKDSIQTFQITDENLWFVGIMGDVKYPDSDISVALVASVLEYGSQKRNIPPRPLFRTVRREMRRELKQFMETKNKEFLNKVTGI